MTPFVARIGPARITAGLVALAYGAGSMIIETAVRGHFDLASSVTEILALLFGVMNVGEECFKAYFRNRVPMIIMDATGILDRRIMKQKVLWADVDWMDPQPAGLPDRLRIMGKVELTPFGRIRNFLIRLLRRLPKGEVAITFGGLDKAGAQATTWIADHIPGFVSDVWKSKELAFSAQEEHEHGEMFISASVFPRQWLGAYLGNLFSIFLIALVAAWFPSVLADIEELGAFRLILEKVVGFPMFAGTFLVGVLTTGIFFGLQFWVSYKQGDGLVQISDTGFSNSRLSSQFVPWRDVESVVFNYKDAGRLIQEAIPVYVYLREGLPLAWPSSKYFRTIEFFRRLSTPEIAVLGHWGTTTSVSEIIETIQRHNLPVAIREVARG